MEGRVKICTVWDWVFFLLIMSLSIWAAEHVAWFKCLDKRTPEECRSLKP